MDKNIIKNHLSKRFLSEAATPGISVTNKVKKESGKINKKGVGQEAKDSMEELMLCSEKELSWSNSLIESLSAVSTIIGFPLPSEPI